MRLTARLTARLTVLVTTPALALAGLVALSVSTAAPASAAAQVIPVPTSAAGLGRIVTAPNGTIWFVEEDANKVGMIQNGAITKEIPFPARFPGTTTVKDIAVAPDSSVWVLYQQGQSIAHLDANGGVIAAGDLGQYEYADEIRVTPDGTAWFTVSAAGDSFVRYAQGNTLSYYPNSPECEESLGLGRDGSVWCRSDSGLTRLNAPGVGGGTSYPANNFAAYPYAIAGGPVGSIWFGRYFGGTIFTSPDDGEVGYLDAGSGAVTAFNTGERTAPADLVQGPDGNMWFASIGAAKGIGHVSPAGTGALTQVGGYAPTSLTFALDGSVWFTDSANNVIVRVPTSDLQVTNVDPGAGSIFTVGQPATSKPPVKVTGKKTVRVARGRVPLTLSCPKGTAGGCKGKVVLTTAKAVKKPGAGKKATAKVLTVAAPAKFTLKAGKKTTVRPRLTKLGTKVVKRGKATTIAVTVGGARIGTLKVRR